MSLSPLRLACLFLAFYALGLARLRLARSSEKALAQILTQSRKPRDAEPLKRLPDVWLRNFSWALCGLAPKLPFRTDCLVRVMAAEHILRRRAGVTIHVQAGQLNDIFTAHAWVSCQGIDMTGGAVAGLHSLDRPVPSL